MLKSISVVIAGGLLMAAPAAVARQSAQTPAPAAQQTPAIPAAPAASATGQTPAAAPAVPGMPADMKNPVKPTPDSLARAKQIYSIDCALCHGDNGNGKTDLATSMGLTLTDFTDPKTLAGRGDGELFNLIRNGKDKMPPEDKARASDNQVWNVILYVRSFAKPATDAAAK